MAMAARNRARTPVRIRCIKKTTPPETSCGTAEEAYKVPPSLTVAVRDQQLRLDPSRRPRPEQHSPRIPLVPRALLRPLETELLTSPPQMPAPRERLQRLLASCPVAMRVR